ncbi:hypothetical protein L3X38_011591 [Prunus dulcis]|uniref:Ubiquitin-like protease family profile domain-containing protein n=1 Tax=Prunus dulcis TaxID=3755 RepID=A0AAD4WHN8_PRUDU|nr:hypothetical protein L3X38_011591 [Prunus dulcis]
MLLMSIMLLFMQQLLYLYSVFHDDILTVFETGWTFSSFSVVSPLDANVVQPNGVDCGIFVTCKIMVNCGMNSTTLMYSGCDLLLSCCKMKKNQLRDVISEALKVMKNAYDFTAKGKKIGNVEV